MPRKALYIVGPSSTGKTTLCLALAKRLGLSSDQVTTEIARSVMRTHGFTRKDVNRLEMQEAILQAILEKHESESLEFSGRYYQPPGTFQIHDRSAIDPIVYAILTSNDAEEAVSRKEKLINTPKFQYILEEYRQSTFILLKPVKEWIVDDGVRSVGDLEPCLDIFRHVLRECGIQFREIGLEMAFLEERVAWVLSLCKVV